ncbi:LOW QUALITY PROTEIN: hypothetical protein Cgig2_002995 [Carnegiea gigantea]|uniref:Uncharacterized protein n=1 Tax=Carnegiea gigantea TaxID=171969 RepID=A0A9Q1K5V9_9CARY|nr:LOW QUALITY PROTEIN: hypothetical protein Cgig2_002995 [Carnegiea gigantea]
MIRLPVHYGDKNKFKSLEVDFLVVDVPTACNVIIGRLTLHRVKAVGLVASSLATSTSDEGGINSTSSGSQPSAAARSRSSIKCRPQNTGCPQILLQGLARPCGGIRECQSGLAGSPPLWLRPHQPRPSLADVAALSSRSCGLLGSPATSHSVSSTGRRAPLTARTPRQPQAKTSAMAISSSDTFGGSEARGAVKSQDLTMSWTRKSLTPGSALMKLAEGHGVSKEALLTTGEFGAPAWQGSVPLMTGSPIGERPAGWPSPPPPVRGGGPSLARLSLSPLLLTDRQTRSGPLPAGYRGGRLCLSSSLLCSVAAATCLGVASPVSNTVSRPSLDLHKTNRKSVPLAKFLRIRRPAAARKKLLAKNFSLGSQFNGSRSLDLFFLFSGPFIDSIA